MRCSVSVGHWPQRSPLLVLQLPQLFKRNSPFILKETVLRLVAALSFAFGTGVLSFPRFLLFEQLGLDHQEGIGLHIVFCLIYKVNRFLPALVLLEGFA